MGGVGGVGGVGGAGVGAVGAVAAPGAGAAAQTSAVQSSGPTASPSAVVNISPQGFMQSFISAVAATENSAKTLTDTLVAAAVLNALTDDDEKKKNNNLAGALLAVAAVQAYQQANANFAGSAISAVPGAGASVSVSISA